MIVSNNEMHVEISVYYMNQHGLDRSRESLSVRQIDEKISTY